MHSGQGASVQEIPQSRSRHSQWICKDLHHGHDKKYEKNTEQFGNMQSGCWSAWTKSMELPVRIPNWCLQTSGGKSNLNSVLRLQLEIQSPSISLDLSFYFDLSIFAT